MTLIHLSFAFFSLRSIVTKGIAAMWILKFPLSEFSQKRTNSTESLQLLPHSNPSILSNKSSIRIVTR